MEGKKLSPEEKMQKLEAKYDQLKESKDFIMLEDFTGPVIDKNNMKIKCSKTIYNYEELINPQTKKPNEDKNSPLSHVNSVDWN